MLRRIQGRVFSIDDPEHPEIEINFEPRWLPSLEEFSKSMRAEEN